MPFRRAPALVSIALALSVATAPAARGDVFEFGHLLPQDAAAYRLAFDAARKGRWKSAYRQIEGVEEPTLRRVLRWKDLDRGPAFHAFGAYVAFIRSHPGWPRLSRLARYAEEAIDDEDPDGALLQWFEDRAPVTANGAMRYAAILRDIGNPQEARRIVTRAWRDLSFTKAQERAFLKAFGAWIDPDLHVERLDRLLWDGHSRSARRQLRRVSEAWRKLAEARMRLRRNRGGVDWAISQVPAHLAIHPGLVYERVRWRRRKRRLDDAAELLAAYAGPEIRPSLWWTERSILARHSFREGEVVRAYRLAAGHDLNPERDPADYAEAQFLSGWLALRLGDRPGALAHFRALHDAVSYPISLARGAYWTGRALDALGQAGEAQEWYRTAASYVATFYGQAGASRLRSRVKTAPAVEPKIDVTRTIAFARNELARAVGMLAEIGELEIAETFFRHLSRARAGPEQRLLIARLAEGVGRPDFEVIAGKHAQRDHILLPEHGYPILPAAIRPTPARGGEPALVHALIRQESAFDARAVSRAGARGLMQLMPATAKASARRLGVPYARRNLTRDPGLNVTLGTYYLKRLLRRYDGSYVLALAAYNAGPHRVDRWIDGFGDPRSPGVDAIDWIETIPFSETRTYVQRVMESLQIYRGTLQVETNPHELTLQDDLARGVRPGAVVRTPLPRPRPKMLGARPEPGPSEG